MNKNLKDETNNGPVNYSCAALSPEVEALSLINNFVKKNGLTPRSQRDNRSLAFQILYAIDRCEYMLSPEEVVEGFVQSYGLKVDYDSFAFALLEGTLNNLEAADLEISKFLENWVDSRVSCTVRILLRMAIWEINFAQTPVKAVLDEYIELAKGFGEKDSFRIINGILDAYIKSRTCERDFVQEQMLI